MKRFGLSVVFLPAVLSCMPLVAQDVMNQRVDMTLDHIRALNEYISEFSHVRRAENGGLEYDYSKVEGTPYYQEDFMKGRIILNSGKVYGGPMRLNQYTEMVEIKSEDGSVFSIKDADEISAIMIGDHKFVYRPDPDDLYHSIAMESLYEGDYSLYQVRSTRFQAAVAAQAYQEPHPARFVRNNDRFYLLHADGYSEIKSKKSLLNVLKDKQNELKAYIKTENLDVKVPSDLVKILEYHNQLGS